MLSKDIIIATSNKGKVKEFKSLVEPIGYSVKSLSDFSGLPTVVEDGETFYANALKKAREIAEVVQLPVVADDSGLCVDALGGSPGVKSARFAGEHATDADNNDKLLEELSHSSKSGHVHHAIETNASTALLSKAHFVCALVLYHPTLGQIAHVEGICDGFIISEPKGEHGFGYDPLFYLPEYKKTMAELSAEEKNKVSHRGKAMKQLLDRYLVSL